MTANESLRAHRKRRGWSLDDVAAALAELGGRVCQMHLSVTGNTVGRWERGRSAPRPPYPKLLCMLFDASAHELGLVDAGFASIGPSGHDTLSEVERRAFLRLLGAATGGAAAELLALSGSPSPGVGPELVEDQSVVEAVTTITGQYRRLEGTTPSRILLDPVLGHLRLASGRLRRGADADRPRLAAAASEVAGLAGWLALDMNDHASAGLHYQSAIDLAGQAGNDLLEAYMLGSMSLWAAAGGNAAEGVRLVESARTLLPEDAPPAPRAWLAAVEATSHAAAHDAPATMAAIDRAERAVGQTGRDHEALWPWVYPFDEATLATYRGACAVRLRLPHVAVPALSRALEAGGPATTKRRAVTLTDLATGYVLADQVDEASSVAAEAFMIGVARGSEKIVQRVREVRLQLAPYRTQQAVRDLDETLLEGFLHPS